MHALERIHAALVGGGALIDIHPIPPAEQAEARGQVLGRLDEDEFFEIVRDSERDLAGCELFTLEVGIERDVVERFDTHEEFFEIVGDRTGTRIPTRLASRVRAARPPIDLRERVAFRRYRALDNRGRI